MSSPAEASTLKEATLETALVPGPVGYAVLTPPPAAGSGPLPLLLWLHGGGGDHGFLALNRPLFERAWQRGDLPPLIVATPSAGRSFYLDYRDGSQCWESFLLEEFLPHVRRTHDVVSEREGMLVAGISMGGMGSLRLAFKHPEVFRAVAALEPGIEPALSWADVPLRDRIYRDAEVIEERFGRPVDDAYWQANNPANLARDRGLRIADSGLAIYLECGDADAFFLHQGAEFLHRVLFDQAIPHEYRLVRGADHLGASLGRRVLDALQFLGRVLNPPPADARGAAVPLTQFHALVAQMKRRVGYRDLPPRRTLAVEAGEVRLWTTVEGEGPTLVLLPSLGRGASDFDDLAARLAVEGYRVVRPEPRGIGLSRGPLEGLTLHDLANDVAAVIDAVGEGPVTVVGHAFGNRVARTLATDHPERVARVILLAAGGKVAPPPEITQALRACFDEDLPAPARLDAVGRAFFADGNDPSVWREGWHPVAAAAQSAAGRATPPEEWWAAGGSRLLVLQGMEDAVAPPRNAELLTEEHGERVHIVPIEKSGHAMLPEQPEAIAAAIVAWLGGE